MSRWYNLLKLLQRLLKMYLTIVSCRLQLERNGGSEFCRGRRSVMARVACRSGETCCFPEIFKVSSHLLLHSCSIPFIQSSLRLKQVETRLHTKMHFVLSTTQHLLLQRSMENSNFSPRDCVYFTGKIWDSWRTTHHQIL